jgi:tetratricopeptide (TPR) repeat protein
MNFRQLAIVSLVLVFQSPAFASGFLDNDYAYVQKGKIAYQAGQFDQAIRPLSEAIQANPNSAEAYYWRALSYIGMNQSERALGDLNSAVKLNSSVPAFFVSRGTLYANDKKYDLAIADFDSALQLDPYLQEAKTNKDYCAHELTRPHEIASHPPEPVKAETDTTSASSTIASAQISSHTDANRNAGTMPSGKDEARAIAALNAKLEREMQERQKFERELAEVKKREKQKEKAVEIETKSRGPSAAAVDTAATRKVEVETKVSRVVDDKQATQLAVDAVNEQSASRPVKDKWAVIVGISKFENPDLNLHYPSKDAEDFYKYLTTKGNFAKDHVKLLVDENATRQNILTLVGDKWLPHVANPDDLVVIYISSHGSSSEMDSEGVNYLLAYDSNVDSLYSSGLAMQDLTRTIKARVHSDRVVMILDACHSGAATPDSKGIERGGNVNAAAIAQGTGQLVISSSAPDQVSWESKKDENSVFTKYLMEGLAQKGDKTTLEDAFQFMKDKVQQEVLAERGVLQTPVLRSKWKGSDLVLNAKPANPREALPFNLGAPVESKIVSGSILPKTSVQQPTMSSVKSTATVSKSAPKPKP